MAPIVLGTANAGGINRKMGAIKNFIKTDKIDILAITETKHKFPIKLENYQINSKLPTAHRSGGVALATHPLLRTTNFNIPNNFHNLDLVANNLFINNMHIIIFCYYNKPQNRISAELIDFFANLPHAILMGDLNARHTDFGDTAVNTNGRQLSSLLATLPCIRIKNNSPTLINHRGSSIIDHILITESLFRYFKNECHIGTTITSDHLPLLTELNIARPKQPPLSTQILDIKNTNWEKFSLIISNNISQPIESTDTAVIESQITEFTKTIQTAKQIATPTKIIHKHQNPLPAAIITLIKTKRRVYRAFCKNHDPSLKTEFNRLNAQIRRDINTYNQDKWIKTCNQLNYRDGAKFWNKLKSISKLKSTPQSPLLNNNIPISDPLEKANIFANQLKDTYRTQNPNEFDEDFFTEVINHNRNLFNTNNINLTNHEDFNKPIDHDEVKNIIINIKNRKAPGPDSLKAQHFKNLPEIALSALVSIYNNCLKSGYFPVHFKTAITIMIPKPGKPKTDPNNYRPIALLNISGKIFEKILAYRIKNLLESNNLLPSHQHGFRAQHTTMDAVLKLQAEATKFINYKRTTLTTFLDIEKAFDRIWHEGLLFKLKLLKLNNPIIKIIQSFLTNRSGQVKLGTAVSEFFPINAGVPQGSVLSPTLFNLYVTDIPTTDTTKILMFADDTVIWSSHSDIRIASKNLQIHLNHIHNWTQKWRITLNPSKSQAIAFTHNNLQKTRRKLSKIKLTINSIPIPLSPKTTYLGITLQPTMSLDKDISATIAKIRKRTNILKMINSNYKGCNTETLIHTYKTFIRPLIDYRAPIYASANQIQLNLILRTERRILRLIHRLPPRFPSNQLYSKINFTPITERLTHLQKQFTYRAISNNTPSNSTLLTPFFITPTNQHLPKIPKKKITHPTAALLEKSYSDLPQEHQEIFNATPPILRLSAQN